MEKSSAGRVLRIAGSFIAWIIGSGFATGQEVLQFFSSYGIWAYGVAAVDLIGFMLVGYLLVRTGFEHRSEPNFQHYQYYCGKPIGTAYVWLVTATLILLMPVLVAGAGAALYEYYGIPTRLGTAIMAALVFAAYCAGFERLMKIISTIGPVIIAFSLLVGGLTLIKDSGQFTQMAENAQNLSSYRPAPMWLLSGILYLGLNFFPGSAYFTRLGTAAHTKKEVAWGAMLGAGMLMLSIVMMGTAIMLNGDAAAGLDVPVLYLARKISNLFGGCFSVTLALGIFSSSSAMMWSVCSRFTYGGKRGNLLFALGLTVFTYVVSQFSFSRLVAVFYPVIGYVGLFFIGCVIYKGLRPAARKEETRNVVPKV